MKLSFSLFPRMTKPLLAFTTFLYTYSSIVEAKWTYLSDKVSMIEGHYPQIGEDLCQDHPYCLQAFVYNITSNETLLQIARISDLQDPEGSTLQSTERFITAQVYDDIDEEARYKTKASGSLEAYDKYRAQLIKNEFNIRQQILNDTLFNSTYQSYLSRASQEIAHDSYFNFKFLESIVKSLQIQYTPNLSETFNQEYCFTVPRQINIDEYKITYHVNLKYKGLPLKNATEFDDKLASAADAAIEARNFVEFIKVGVMTIAVSQFARLSKHDHFLLSKEDEVALANPVFSPKDKLALLNKHIRLATENDTIGRSTLAFIMSLAFYSRYSNLTNDLSCWVICELLMCIYYFGIVSSTDSPRFSALCKERDSLTESLSESSSTNASENKRNAPISLLFQKKPQISDSGEIENEIKCGITH